MCVSRLRSFSETRKLQSDCAETRRTDIPWMTCAAGLQRGVCAVRHLRTRMCVRVHARVVYLAVSKLRSRVHVADDVRSLPYYPGTSPEADSPRLITCRSDHVLHHHRHGTLVQYRIAFPAGKCTAAAEPLAAVAAVSVADSSKAQMTRPRSPSHTRPYHRIRIAPPHQHCSGPQAVCPAPTAVARDPGPFGYPSLEGVADAHRSQRQSTCAIRGSKLRVWSESESESAFEYT